MQPVHFRAKVPQVDLCANVRHALSLGLPELPWPEERAGTIRVLANGPSAWRAPLYGKTLALNGALRIFAQDGKAPTYWAACDPQKLVAGFVIEPPKSTTYLVASKCDPLVFKFLEGRKVILWHVAEPATWDLISERQPVRSGHSITTSAFDLMARLGFAAYDVWGWDCCYGERGQVHAGDCGKLIRAGRDGVVSIEVGEREFLTNAAWAMEAQNAVRDILPYYDAVLRGGGMVDAMRTFYG